MEALLETRGSTVPYTVLVRIDRVLFRAPLSRVVSPPPRRKDKALSQTLSTSLFREKPSFYSRDSKGCDYLELALTTGCADGSREGFFNEKNVAGCLGNWDGLKSLRDRPTRHWCGNKFSNGNSRKCLVPSDLCDSENGWQVCGYGGVAGEIPGYINSGTCKAAGYGRFSAGINHCSRKLGACDKPKANVDYGCSHYDLNDLSCDEPLCCGLDCEKQDKVDCDGAFWPGATTYTPLSEYKGCARLTAAEAGGVMCCCKLKNSIY